jgi:hypothetical protein
MLCLSIHRTHVSFLSKKWWGIFTVTVLASSPSQVTHSLTSLANSTGLDRPQLRSMIAAFSSRSHAIPAVQCRLQAPSHLPSLLSLSLSLSRSFVLSSISGWTGQGTGHVRPPPSFLNLAPAPRVHGCQWPLSAWRARPYVYPVSSCSCCCIMPYTTCHVWPCAPDHFVHFQYNLQPRPRGKA